MWERYSLTLTVSSTASSKTYLPEIEGVGRIAVFKNHSKIYAGFGPKFAFAVESSANINTNPRTENGCITIDRGIYEFYREFFDGIKSFE